MKDNYLLKLSYDKKTSDYSLSAVQELTARREEYKIGGRLPLKAPLRVYYDITYLCNLACTYCYNRNRAKVNRQLLRLDEKMAVLDQMKEMGTLKLSIAGGEPFLDDDLHPLVEKAHNLGIAVSVTTNGTRLTDADIAFIQKAMFKRITVSIDGASAQANRHRKGLCFDIVVSNIEKLKYRTDVDIALKMVIGLNVNLEAILGLVRFAEKRGINLIKISFLRRNMARKTIEYEKLTNKYFRIMWQLSGLKKQTSLRISLPSIAFDNFFGYPNLLTGWGCAAGKDLLYINPYGDVKPCVILGDEYLMGNIRDCTLASIWRQKVKDLFPMSKECVDCKYVPICYGGCRARAIQFFGKVSSRDVFCYRDYVERSSMGRDMAEQRLRELSLNMKYCLTHL